MNRDDLLKEFSELINNIEEIERKIGEVTNPRGCRVYKSEGMWIVVKPPEEIPNGTKQEILVISNVEAFVTNKQEFEKLIEEFQKVKDRMNEIVNELERLGEPGIEIMKRIIEEYH